MTRMAFKDFDEFADAINGLAGRFIPTARSQMDWWVQRVPIGRVPIQQVQIGGASTFAGDGTPGTLTLGIPVTTPQRIRIDGSALESNSLILIKETQLFTFAARQPTLWAGITVPIDHPLLSPELLRSLSLGASGRGAATRIQSELQAMNAAKLLVSRICMENDSSVDFTGAAAAMAAEEETVVIATRVLESRSEAPELHFGRRRIPRDRIIARALAMVEAFEGRPLFIQDLCRATHVSERTLRNIFREYFGVGPMRLVKVWRLHQINRALAAADSIAKNVSSIAAHFGIWDLDAFARNYVALYGETPATTLRRPPRASDRGQTLNATWIRYASRRFCNP
jgi:AraC family transcriptional regulator, ethanolamine operon transcriptional activator